MCHIEASSSSPSSPSNLRSRPTPSHINMRLGGTQRRPRPLLIPDAGGGGFGVWGESKSTLRRRVAELDALRSSFITSPGVSTSLSCLFSTVHSKKMRRPPPKKKKNKLRGMLNVFAEASAYFFFYLFLYFDLPAMCTLKSKRPGCFEGAGVTGRAA